MAKKKHKHRKKYRNNGGGRTSMSVAPAAPRRRNRRNTRADKPDFWGVASAVAGGLGGAALGGWAARKGYDPRWVGAALAGAGGLAAWKFDGNIRGASYGLAAAGAGQSLLEFLDKDEEAAKNENHRQQTAKSGAKAGEKSPDTGEAGIVYTSQPTDGARRQSRHGGAGLDRAFNRVRERLQRIYDDEDDDRFVEEEDAA